MNGTSLTPLSFDQVAENNRVIQSNLHKCTPTQTVSFLELLLNYITRLLRHYYTDGIQKWPAWPAYKEL